MAHHLFCSLCRNTFGAQRECVKLYVLACTSDEAYSAEPLTVTGAECANVRHLESVELRHLERAMTAARTAAASVDGILDLDFGSLESEPEPHLFRRVSGLLGGQRGLTMPKQPLALLIPKGAERRMSSDGNAGRWSTVHMQAGSCGGGDRPCGHSPEPSSSDKLLWEMFMPQHVSISSAFCEQPEHSALLQELALSAHTLLASQSPKVLAQLLLSMGSNTFKRMQLAPYLLAMLRSNQYNANHQQPALAAEHLLQVAAQKYAQIRESLSHVTPSELQKPLPGSSDVSHSLDDLLAAMVCLSSALEKAQLACGRTNAVTPESCGTLQEFGKQLTEQRQTILDAHEQVIRALPAAGNLTWEVHGLLSDLQQVLGQLGSQLDSIDAQVNAAAQAMLSAQLGDRNSRNTLLYSAVAALDIEKAASNKDIETWPHYARHAAAGMHPVHTILEIGYATYQSSNAYQVTQALAKEQEACSGMVGGARSQQYPAGPRSNINTVAYRNVRLGGCRQQVPNSDAARAKCAEALGSNLICCHNRSGFDELALLRDKLLAVAGLYGPGTAAVSSSRTTAGPLQAIWQAAKQLAAKNEVPAFLGALDLCHSLHKELFVLMEQQQETQGVVKRAKEQGYKSVPAPLERACEVMPVNIAAETAIIHDTQSMTFCTNAMQGMVQVIYMAIAAQMSQKV